jgi:hypothetical protein
MNYVKASLFAIIKMQIQNLFSGIAADIILWADIFPSSALASQTWVILQAGFWNVPRRSEMGSLRVTFWSRIQ